MFAFYKVFIWVIKIRDYSFTMIQTEFAERIKDIVKHDNSVLGLAVAGSWLDNELDEYSDLDLILVTRDKITDHKENMFNVARRFGDVLSAFTGEHVGEPRLLICVYDNPLLHVDIKFLTLEEFDTHIENPVILSDTNGQLANILTKTDNIKFPYPEYQWIEDRFWVWIFYIIQKIGRGENIEAFDGFGFLRSVVFGPLLHIKNGNLPRGVRKVEAKLTDKDLKDLIETIPLLEKRSMLKALRHCIALYKRIRKELYPEDIQLQERSEKRIMEYFREIESHIE